MGRSSGLILQAVCLGRWLTERQADAYVIAAKRHDSETASAGSLSVCDKSRGFDSAHPPCGGDQSYWRRKSRYLPGRSCRSSQVTCYLSLEHDWWKQVTTSSGSVTAWNNPYSVVQWCVGVGGGSCFHHKWHLKDTQQCCPENTYEPAWPHRVWGQGWVTPCLSVMAGYVYVWGSPHTYTYCIWWECVT